MNYPASIEIPQNIENLNKKNHILERAFQAIGRSALILGLATSPVLAYSADVALNADSAYAAETGGYPDADAIDCSTQFGIYSWCKKGTSISPRGFAYRNCTDWAAYRAHRLTGVSVPYGQGMGHANTWDDNGRKYFTVDKIPEPGDIAQSDAGGFGHVGVVESISHDATGKVSSILVSEYNKSGSGNYSILPYTSDSQGNFWHQGRKWDNFIDLNGTGKGINGQPVSNAQPKGRLALINSVQAAYSKDEITPGGWHPLTANGDARYVSASDTHLAIINSAGEAWGGDVGPDRLKANSPGLVPLYVPRDPNHPGGVRKIEVDKDGNMIAITNCSSAWGWRNKPGGQRWVPMTNCDDALDVDVGSGHFGLVNSCGGAYISDVEYAWTQALKCGDAKDIAIGETGRIMVINSLNTAYIYNPAANAWVNKTPVGDARQIAIGKDRIMVVTSSGAAWAADIGQNNYMRQ